MELVTSVPYTVTLNIFIDFVFIGFVVLRAMCRRLFIVIVLIAKSLQHFLLEIIRLQIIKLTSCSLGFRGIHLQIGTSPGFFSEIPRFCFIVSQTALPVLRSHAVKLLHTHPQSICEIEALKSFLVCLYELLYCIFLHFINNLCIELFILNKFSYFLQLIFISE